MVFSFFFHNPDMPWQCGAAPMCTCMQCAECKHGHAVRPASPAG